MRWFGLLLLTCACGHAPRDAVVQNRTEAPYVPPRCSAEPPACLPEELAPDLRGKVVLVEYWATWCSPCKADVTVLNALDERFRGDDVAILGISTEALAPDELAQALRDFDVRYPMIPIDVAVAAGLDVPSSLPTGYLYDALGYRQDVHVGMWDEHELADTIEGLLAER